MEQMTVQQAAEWGKNLDFPQVWTAIMQNSANIDRLTEEVRAVHQHVGGVGNTLGGIMEDMFASKIWDKFNAFGYTFTKAARDLILRDEKWNKIAEVDAFLENGDFVMAVEVKARLEVSDINEHLARLNKIRVYMNEHGDKRKLLGAMAGGYVIDSVKEYAEKNGLYVLVQEGDSVIVAENPKEFKGKIWQ
ncbi:MAG: hypothetical protein LBM77_05525 [Spirochaetaceae bacterium]|jgi:hypothetical protein|nr:hypothetical protein [Spirochaetaceae bacterium]